MGGGVHWQGTGGGLQGRGGVNDGVAKNWANHAVLKRKKKEEKKRAFGVRHILREKGGACKMTQGPILSPKKKKKMATLKAT